MANYIEKIMNLQQGSLINKVQTPNTFVQNPIPSQNRTIEPKGSNILEKFMQNQGLIAAPQVKPVVLNDTAPLDYKNDLRTKFQNNDIKLMGVIMRNLGAEDKEGDQLIRGNDIKGNFNNAVKRLDEFKNLGINALHVLPVNPPGKQNAMGTAGSVYAPADFLKIDPALDDPNDPRDVKEEFKNFINECHKRGMSVMIDLPSCASYDLFKERPELMAFEKDGTPKTPGGWDDIRMFNPWKDETKRELNPDLIKMHEDFVDMCIDLGVDGIRADVSRTKPTEFWDILINYSRQKDPEFAWLAESYTYEDASPQLNMNYDRPQDALRAGFDSYYGQYHIFHEWTKASDLTNYVKENLQMSQELEPGKSLIGSFGTHDDVSIMNHGGVTYTNLVSGIQATLPMLNPYYFDGYQSGDDYIYDFQGKTDEQTDTDCNECTVHKGKPDIFNFSRPLIGKYPECGDFMKNTLDVRNMPQYHDILTKGSFIPLKTEKNDDDQIIAYARHLNGKTLLVVANKNVNTRQGGRIEIPGMKESQKLNNLFKSYGENSTLQAADGCLNVDLGPGRVHLFEIDTPDIENSGVEVFRQNL
ncbi:MAG: hypothetical protein LUG16_03655 [Candidatus Gastranaerophilales bacterium]|nr:hypothetical protein [Candidatus Gastranaerophilales bacterium]